MKAFNVVLVTKDPNVVVKVKQTIQGLGKWVEEESGAVGLTVLRVIPSNQDNTCATIRDLIRADVNVFEDKVMVSLISPDYVSFVNWNNGEEIIGDEDVGGKEKRNFERFDNRHDAYVAFGLEKPKWVYGDGVNMGTTMRFDDWCWLPVKRDGIYERGKYEKYIEG